LSFLEGFNPKNVLILSGDHIYKMHYGEMLRAHKESGAAATIAVMPVPWEEASRFGIMSTNEEGEITEFAEKPAEPKSNLASMGIYIFSYDALKKYLTDDERDPSSDNDFGKNIIPTMLKNGEKMMSYRFEGYWKDVGTIQSLWEANMDLIDEPPKFSVEDRSWIIYSRNMALAPHYAGKSAKIANSTITEGCSINGEINHSVIFGGVEVGEGTKITDSVIMPGAKIGKNVVIEKAVIGVDAVVEDGAKVGVSPESDANPLASKMCTHGIVLIEGTAVVKADSDIAKGSMVEA
jgi:glucose-1-phosphate adenylyltransferase